MSDSSNERSASWGPLRACVALLAAGLLALHASGCADECDGVECKFGVCEGGECVDAESCSDDDDCLRSRLCRADGVCVPDPCYEVECRSGAVCDRVTGECHKERACSSRGAGGDCGEAERCIDGVCRPDPQAVCERLDCRRGECDGRLGRCVNTRECSSITDCLEGFVCTGQNTCVDRDEACEELDCPGNTTCQYDSETTELTCVESGQPCRTSFDCEEGRRCTGELCENQVDCEEDDHEPNDTADEATPLVRPTGGAGRNGRLCGGGVDYYSFDLDDINRDMLRGVAYFSVHLAEHDVGLGAVELEVFDEEGHSVGSAVAGTDEDDQTATVELSVGAADARSYTARVAPAGEVAREGVTYTVDAQFVEAAGARACDEPRELVEGETASGDTGQTGDEAVRHFGSSCTDMVNLARDQLYRFELDETSRVRLELEPEDGDDDVSLSVRESCRRPGSEVGCANLHGEGETEVFEKSLEAGAYGVIVQAPEAVDDDGAFDLTLEAEPVECAETSSYCVDEQTARVCPHNEGEFDRRECRDGCARHSGQCAPVKGERCERPIALEDGDTVPIDWWSFQNDYEMPADSCVDNGRRTHTSGPDAVFAVQLEPDHAFEANLQMADGQRGSLYLLSSCVSPASSCVKGANESTLGDERMTLVNDSSQTRHYWLVADIARDSVAGEATLSYETHEVVCTPSHRRCTDEDEVERCRELGQGFEVVDTCEYGCAQGACKAPPNDTCEEPRELADGDSITEPIEAFGPDFGYRPPTEGCTSKSVPGRDAVYQIETTAPGQRVEIEVDAPWDVAITAARDCHVDQARCLTAADGDDSPQTLEFTARTADEYFIIVDGMEADQQGDFTVSADISTPGCTPGEIIGCEGDTLEFCDASGTPKTYTCDGGCSDKACQDPRGDACEDPEVLGDQDSVTASLGGDNDVELPPRRFGRCALDQLDETHGPDDVYRVDLQAGELLEASLSSAEDDTFMFIVEDCFFAAETCLDNHSVGGPATLHHYAETDQSVYVIVDSGLHGSTDQYTLDVDISQDSQCAPDATRCVDSKTVERCDGEGDAVLGNYTCSTGCTGGECFVEPHTADACGGAPDAGDGISVFADRSRLDNDITLPLSLACVDEYGSGRDLFYRVTLEEGDTLRAESEGMGGETPMIYLLDTCDTTSATCLAGDVAGEDNVASVTYQATSSQTVYVGADSLSAVDEKMFSLIIDRIEGE